ncbi:MAG: hypothetical protein K9N23_03940 [Akkermansiaceae bacterium]|nr:hypothetical protein [Akkermansiaceae bacterium]
MKTKQNATGMVALMCVSVIGILPAVQAQATRIPSVPLGTVDAFPTIVQTGTKPTLTWSIVYPSKLKDVAFINPPGTLVPTEDVYVSVQPIGTGIVGCSSNPVAVDPPPQAEARVSLNGSAYKQLFYGTQSDIDPSSRYYIKKLKGGDTLDFGGRYVVNGSWTPFYTTRSANLQVIALADGQTIPTALPLYQQSYLAKYLRPYLDGTGKVRVGPMSVLILMELNQTNHSENCFDYQDCVLLVTFSKQHPNNGHGNNLDGVDSSNPGGGGGGPNGADDPSGGVDDEKRDATIFQS